MVAGRHYGPGPLRARTRKSLRYRCDGRGSMAGMPHDLVRAAQGPPGDRVAVLSPSFAAAGAFPAVHEQAMRRLAEVTGLVSRSSSRPAQGRRHAGRASADVNAAFADPGIRAMLGGDRRDDQITVIPHLDAALAGATPSRPGLQRQHQHASLAVGERHRSFYGGRPGPPRAGSRGGRGTCRSLRAALVTGERIEITSRASPRTRGGLGRPARPGLFRWREPAGPWSWHGPARTVTGRAWGGCVEVNRGDLHRRPVLVRPRRAEMAEVLLLETSEELLPARHVGWIVRALGERGILAAVDAVLVARPPVSDFTRRPPAGERARLRAEQRDVVTGSSAVQPGCCRVRRCPFGHTRPAVDPPHGGPSPSTAPHAGSPPTTHNQAEPRRPGSTQRREHHDCAIGGTCPPATHNGHIGASLSTQSRL